MCVLLSFDISVYFKTERFLYLRDELFFKVIRYVLYGNDNFIFFFVTIIRTRFKKNTYCRLRWRISPARYTSISEGEIGVHSVADIHRGT